jgi:nucleotide-binding universal stress UspA family protein
MMSTQPAVPAPARGAARLRKIVFPSDLSPASDQAFAHARLLAEQFEARLVLYHALVVQDPQDLGYPPQPAREMWRRAELAAREHLERRLSGLEGGVIHLQRTTSVPRALASFVEGVRPDLVVMATHGREGLAHLLHGSVTESLLDSAHPPVLCVRQPEHGAALPYRRVLVATDLSPASRRTFDLAATLARGFDAEVLAVHAVPLRVGSTAGLSHLMESRVPSEEALRRFLLPDFAGLRILPRVLIGPAWEGIVETARQERADVIVMSTHGHDSLGDRVLGSHAEHVVRGAPCPVIVG